MAILPGNDRAAALTLTILPTRSSLPNTPAAKDCIPPIEFPTLAYNLLIPRKSSNLNCALTISKIVMIGNDVAYGLSVKGEILLGPLDPKHPPIGFVQIMKYLFVSRGFPGPMTCSHHPAFVFLGCDFA